MSLDETSQSSLDIVKGDIETVDAIDHDVVTVGLSMLGADDLESVEDITNQSVSLGDEILGLLHVTDESARS